MFLPSGDLGISADPRAPKADITNAPFLFGDPNFGDIDGDPDYGDVNDELVSLYKLTSGDPFGDPDYGDPDYGDLIGDTRAGRFLRKAKGPALFAGAGVGGYLAANAIAKKIKAARAKKLATRAGLNSMAKRQTISSAKRYQNYGEKINRKGYLPFFQLIGAQLTNTPISPGAKYVADDLKFMLDSQAINTPFQQDFVQGIPAGPIWTNTIVGPAAPRNFTHLVLSIGINQLNAAPGTVVSITATIPTTAGLLTIAAQPWIVTLSAQFNVRFMIAPWNLVQNKPLPVLGVYDALNPITVTVNGLPAASQTNLTVPGSLHPWTIALRNKLI